MNLADLLGAIARGLGSAGAYAVIGAVARNAWAPPRATTDLDLTVAARPDALDAIANTLDAVGYRRVRGQRADPGDVLPDILIFRAQSGHPRQVDVLVAKTPFEVEVLRRARPIRVGSTDALVATAEDLVVYKLLAGRPRDWEDVRAISAPSNARAWSSTGRTSRAGSPSGASTSGSNGCGASSPG